MNLNFICLNNNELTEINGGGLFTYIICGVIVLVVGFLVGYGLSTWLG